MNPDRDTTRIVRSWLESGVTDLQDRVLDSVLDQLPATPQRRRTWQARRSPLMINVFKLAMAAAAVVLVGVVGFNLLPGASQSGVGGAVPASPSPSPSASASPESQAVGSGLLAPGRYHIDRELDDWTTSGDGSRTPGGVARVTFDVPDGWTGVDDFAISKASAGTSGALALAPMAIASIFPDPCHWSGLAGRQGAADWERGYTMDGLANGLWTSWASANVPGYSARLGIAPTSPIATKPTTVTLAGLDARYVEVRTPTDVDLATCNGGQYTLWVDSAGGERYVHRAGELNRLWVVDGAGHDATGPRGLLVLDAASHPDSSPEDLAQLQAIIDSVRIEFLDTP